MFRKLVSSLAFSPALVNQLGFYARRLRREQITRRIGLLFTVLAVIMQSFALLTPPDQALASSASDIIPGGVSSVQQVLSLYDASAEGKNDFKNLMDYFGVTRAELSTMKQEKTCSSDKTIVSFGRQHIFSASEGELAHQVPTQQGVSTFYSTPLYLHDRFNRGTFCTDSFVGNSARVGWFSIMKKCGNFQIKQNVRKLPKANFINATCKAVEGFAYDERQLNQSVKVFLFFDGPPGKGRQFGPIIANQHSSASPTAEGHGFSFIIPEEYQKKSQKTTVWGIMQPLAGWTEDTVQFENTATIPNNCTPQPTPFAECTSLTVNIIERTKFSFASVARAENGATIQGYQYQVFDEANKLVSDKSYSSVASRFTGDPIELKTTGKYSIKSTIKTSLGDKSSASCTKNFSVNSQQRCKFSNEIDVGNADCRPCPYNSTIWLKDSDCIRKLAQSKEAKNVTQNSQNANAVTAKPGDRIEYTLLTSNLNDVAITTNINENLADVLEYGTLFQNGDGKFNETSKVLTWENVTLQPGQTDSRKLIIQISDVIPTTPRAGNNPSSYNCIVTNAYGNTINIRIECPISKDIEGSVQQLPSTGPTENMLFAASLLMIVTYFYARSRQLNKEVRLLRKEFTGGTP